MNNIKSFSTSSLALIFVFVCVAVSLNAQNVTYVDLRQTPPDYIPTHFSVARVIDSRAKKGSFGSIDNDGTSLIALHYGLATDLNDYISHNITQDKTKPSIDIHIVSLNVIINKTGSLWISKGSAVYAYYLGNNKLLEFSDEGQQRSGKFSTDYVDMFLRNSITSGMKRFDAWCGENPGKLTGKTAGTKIVGKGKESNPGASQSNKPGLDKDEAEKAFKLLNKIRANPGNYLPAMGIREFSKVNTKTLVWNEALAKVAEAKAMDMAKRGYFDHISPEGYSINYYINKAGYKLDPKFLNQRTNNYFESIQAGAESGEAAMNDLILDAGVPELGHRKHLLGMDDWNSSLVDIGIGFVRTGQGAKYRTFTSVIIAKHK